LWVKVLAGSIAPTWMAAVGWLAAPRSLAAFTGAELLANPAAIPAVARTVAAAVPTISRDGFLARCKSWPGRAGNSAAAIRLDI
jgi:hypothetical protein